jgi:hypothetical protein
MGLKIKENGVFVDVGGGGTSTTQLIDEWVRPATWPAIPVVLPSEQKIVGLHAVHPGDGVGTGGNFFAFNGQGAYTIDFGDGNIQNFASNTQANYSFNFNNTALAGTNKPVTFTAASSTVNFTGHGFNAGTAVPFYNIVSTTGLIEGRRYYVVNPTANTFQVSATIGGSPVILTNDGSATLLPYKIAVVTITPQAGQNLTVINLQARNATGGNQPYSSGWLDLAISVPSVTGANFTLGGTQVGHRLLERANIIACGVLTSLANLYNNTPSLQSVSQFPSSISSVTTMLNMYAGTGLKRFPAYIGPATALQNTNSQFLGAVNAEEFPELLGTTSAWTIANNMYAGCQRAIRIPAHGNSTQFVTNMNGIISNMQSLQAASLNMSGVNSSGNGNIAGSSNSIKRLQITGMRFSFSVSDRQLSAVALNEIFTGLPVVTGQTITVSNNFGIGEAGYNPSIATAKGWTVTS